MMNEFENNPNNFGNTSGEQNNFGGQPNNSFGYGNQGNSPFGYDSAANGNGNFETAPKNSFENNQNQAYDPFGYSPAQNSANNNGWNRDNNNSQSSDFGQSSPFSFGQPGDKEISKADQTDNDGSSPFSQTYTSTYTPGNDGYTRSTEYQGTYSPFGSADNSGVPFGTPQNQNPASIYSSMYTAPQNNASKQKKRKNKNGKSGKTGLIIATVAILVLIIVAAFALFMLKPWQSDKDTGNDTDATPGISDTVDTENTPESDDSKDSSSSNNATTEKTENDNDTKQNIVIPTPPTGEVGELMTKSQVAYLVKDSVVEITTEQVVNGNSFWQYVQSGAGSGVIIDKEGYVITNNHVIDGASKIVVRLTNGNEYEADLIGTDANSDIAVLKISPKEDLTVATLGSSSNLALAEEILVIGNPLGELGGTITNGIVSALAREITIDGEKMTLIQTNAAVNPGNSGGGMFNLYGQLVGIVNAKSSGSDVEGLGFAIPIDTAYDVVLQLMEYGYVRGRVDHGLELLDITDLFTAASYRLSTLGVYVLESKFSEDIKNGDRIASINGKEVSTSAGVKEALYGCKVGDIVEVTLVRKNRYVDVKLTLREYVPENTGNVSFE